MVNQIPDPSVEGLDLVAPRPSQPFAGFQHERNTLGSLRRALDLRRTALDRQAQGVTARPEPIPQTFGFGAIDTARILLETATKSRSFLGGLKISHFLPFFPALAAASTFTGKEGIEAQVAAPKIIQERAAAEIAFRDSIDSMIEDDHSLSWREVILESIPAEVRDSDNPLTDTQQLLERYPLKSITADDIRWAAQLIERAAFQLNQDTRPQLSAEERRRIVIQITNRQSASIRGMIALAGRDLLSTLSEILQPQLPPGLSNADLRAILTDAGYEVDDEEFRDQIDQLTNFARTQQGLWAQADANYQTLRSDLASVTLGELEDLMTRHTIESLVDRPLAAAMLPVDYWRRQVVQPLAGALLLGTAAPFGLRQDPNNPFIREGLTTTEQIINPDGSTSEIQVVRPTRIEHFEQLFHEARLGGESSWASLRIMFEESEIPSFEKFFLEIFADPITYVGFGATSKVLNRIPYVGPSLAGINDGFIAGMDWTFMASKNALYRIAPKTRGQITARLTKQAHRELVAGTEMDNLARTRIAKPFRNIPLEDVKTAFRNGIKLARSFSRAPGPIVGVGHILRMRAPVTMDGLSKLKLQLAEATPGTLHLPPSFQELLDFNEFLGLAKGLEGVVIMPSELAPSLIRRMGFIPTVGRLNIMSDFYKGLVKGVDDTAEGLLTSSNTQEELFKNIFSHIRRVYDAQHDPILKDQATKRATLASIFGHVPNQIKLSWQESFDRLSRGFAKSYLLFSFYSPYNIAENAGKTLYAGLDPTYFGDQGALYQARTVGLLGVDNQLFSGGVTLELGHITAGERIVRGRPVGMSTSTYRRLTQRRRGAWTKFWEGMDTALIKTGANVGRQQQANFMIRAMDRELWRLEPEVMNATRQVLQGNEWRLAEAGFDDSIRGQILNHAESQTSIARDTILNMPNEFTNRAVWSKHQVGLITKYGDIGVSGTNFLVAHAQANTLIPNLEKILGEELPDLVRNEIMHSPEMARIQMNKLLDDFIAIPVDSPEQLAIRTQALNQLGDDISQLISAQTRLTQQEARSVLNLEWKNEIYKEMWDDVLIPFLKESGERVTAYIDELRSFARGPASNLNATQLANYESLLTAQVSRMAVIRDAWVRQRQITDTFIQERRGILSDLASEGVKTPSEHARIEDWWNRFHSSRETSWDSINRILVDVNLGIYDLGEQIDQVVLPRMAPKSGPITLADVAELYGTVPQDVSRALYLPELGVLRDRHAWTQQVLGRAERIAQRGSITAEDLGYTVDGLNSVYDKIVADMLGSAEIADIAAPRLLQLDKLKKELTQYATRKNSLFTRQQSDALRSFSDSVHAQLPADLGGSSFQRSRQLAHDKGVRDFQLNFPDYSSETAFNAIGKAVFPFWTYETHRLFWLTRSFLSTPGTFSALGKYQDYSDQGYLNIPGVPFQINPLRGTIYQGGMRRLLNRDYPEFYDLFPNVSSTFDQFSRYGFFPNIFVSGTFAIAGAATGRSQIGEVIPTIAKFPIEALVALQPSNPVIRQLANIILPERFRDYMVAQEVSRIGGPGPDILDKIYSDTTLTKEEQAWWDRGQGGMSKFNLYSSQMGVLRFRPEERKAFETQAKLVLEQCTGIPVGVQERMIKTGTRISDWHPIPPECSAVVRELEGYESWRGLASHLRESEAGENLALQRIFWDEIAEESDAVRKEQELIDTQFLGGAISRNRWEGQKRVLDQKVHQIIEAKRNSDRFLMDLNEKTFPIPLTVQERLEFADAHGFDPILMHPEDELVAAYYQIELEDKFDLETGQIVTDWDKFFLQRRILEQSGTPDRNERFLSRVRAKDTRLESIRRSDYEEYITPYKKSFDFILNDLPADERAIIREASATDDEDRRKELIAMEREDGTNIVSDFRSLLSDFRQRMRLLDPELDARLILWEGVAAVDDRGLEAWRRLRQRYGFTLQQSPDQE